VLEEWADGNKARLQCERAGMNTHIACLRLFGPLSHLQGYDVSWPHPDHPASSRGSASASDHANMHIFPPAICSVRVRASRSTVTFRLPFRVLAHSPAMAAVPAQGRAWIPEWIAGKAWGSDAAPVSLSSPGGYRPPET
jgi:hypothetical protein